MTRLPTPGGDAGNWGTILNEYLSTVHNVDGSLKSGVVAGSHLADGSITTDKLADASVSATKLASSVQTTLSSVVTTSSLGVAGGIAGLDSSGKVPASQLPEASGGTTPEANATVSGTIRLSGDLGGTASSPIVTKLSGVSLSGTPSAGQALVATSSTVAGWQSISTGGSANPNAGTVWNTASDPATGSTSGSVKDGDMWVDRTTDSANILTKARVNGQWVVMLTTEKPAVPVSDLVTGLTVTNPTSTGVTLSWTAPANPSGTVDGYHVYNNGTKLTTTPLTVTTYNVTLPAETAYSLTVAVVVAGEEKTPSPATTGTTPPEQTTTDDTVTGLSTSNVTSTGLTLSWTAPANPSGTVEGYHVYNNGTKLTTTLVTTTTYNATLPADSAYSLTVVSVVGGQEKTPSTAVTGTLSGGGTTNDTVTGLSASNVTSTGLTLSWTAPANPSGTVEGYHVYNNGTKLTSTLLTATTYNVTLPASTAYSLTVTSVVGGQEKTASTAVTGTTPGGQPTTGLAWPLKISANNRYILDANNAPFIWQGDTAWRLFSGLNREQSIQYLDTRQAQGFNVIQAVAIPRVETASSTNRYGDEPTSGGSVANRVITSGNNFADATQYDYWDHVDYVIDEANNRDMAIALLPVWSTTMAGNEITVANAQGYGEFLGDRYKSKKVIWVMGGDNNSNTYADIWAALAKGIAIGANGSESYANLMITYHPGGTKSSGDYFNNTAWLNFNMSQSGHSAGVSYQKVSEDYGLTPVRPTLDGEPLYEDHPFNWDPAQGFSTPHHVRAREYCAVFAGALGFTYGHHAVWPMKLTKELYNNNLTWDEGILRPAATQMQHLRKLIESRPILTRVPDQGIITSDQGVLNGKGVNTRRQATRDESGSYIMVYLTSGGDVSIDTTKLSSTSAKQWWYNPRTGQAGTAEDKTLSGTMTFSAPSSEDWVLVLDDASRNFPAPGTV